MSDTNRALTERVDKLFEVLGIGSVGQDIETLGFLPVNAVLVSKSSSAPSYGTWVLLASGNLLGGIVGTVYAWQRTA